MKSIKAAAIEELEAEAFRHLVNCEKERILRNKPLWVRIKNWFPFVITRRKK